MVEPVEIMGSSFLPDATPPQQPVLDVVAVYQLERAEPISGKRLRSSLGAEAMVAVESCVPVFLTKTGSPPDESYRATLFGLLNSRFTETISRVVDAARVFLRARFDSDPDFGEYLMSELKAADSELARQPGNFVFEAILVARLSNGGSGSPSVEYRFSTPKHIEEVARWKSFEDVLRYERKVLDVNLSKAVATTKRTRSSARTFSTALHTYEEVEQIGNGGVGIVSRMHDEDDNVYAIKRLKHDVLVSIKRKRFKNELDFCRCERHPRIMQVMDWGLIDIEGVTVPFYVMKLYDKTLANSIDGITPEAALAIFRQIVDAMITVHELGVVHRDLKPENILIDSDGGPVIADFGIAHFGEELLATAVRTQDGERLANFDYSAPEQKSRGHSITTAADVYALGKILGRMLTGTVPDGKNHPTVASTRPELGGIDVLIEMMMDYDPARRPKTEELNDLLTAAERGTLQRPGAV